jgi:dTDP-4-dehydrorhamnose 3,5-epimerase
MQWRDAEIHGVLVRPLKTNHDSRGWLTELFRSDETHPDLMPAMGYVSLTHPGVTRGPHEHVRQTDTFAVLGPGSLRIALWDRRESSPTRHCRMVLLAGEDRPLVVTVPPGVAHSYTNISDRDTLVLNFPNRLYAGPGRRETVDEIRHEDTDASVFTVDEGSQEEGRA